GIPVLDRVAAWLRTFGQQPVVIHCYPEETQDASLNGSLFLHRYAQLYGFFVDERKIPAVRFANMELLRPQNTESGARNSEEDSEFRAPNSEVAVATATPRVVIASLGAGTSGPDGASPVRGVPRWLEFSIMSSRQFFSPEDGDW